MSSNVKMNNVTAEEYLNTLGDKLVQESSLPHDKYHLGKMMLKAFKEYPNRIMQIEKISGKSENIKSFHDRTVRAALMMRERGLRAGDIVSMVGRNHLDMAVPFIACFFDGLSAYAIDEAWAYADLDDSLRITRPKLIFCQNAKAGDIQKSITANDIDCEIITFDDNNLGYVTIREFLQGVKDVNEINNFKPAYFDTTNTTAVMLSSSGSTGPSKCACITYKAFFHQVGLLKSAFLYMGEDRSCLLLSSPPWIDAAIMLISSCLFAFTRIQICDENYTVKDVMEMIQNFKPKWCALTPSLGRQLLRDTERDGYDLTSLQVAFVVGTHVTVDFLKDLEQLIKGKVFNGYGLTETSGNAFNVADLSFGSCGTPVQGVQYKIIDVNSGIENGPNTPGELWIKGPILFKEYYGKPEATKEVFSEDGFLKTGDLVYKNENDHYFFVERIKLLIKYNTHHISPVEIENVIKQHPGVKNVGVTAILHYMYGQLPTAFVVRTAPDSVTEDEIHELVRKNLDSTICLHGGVKFVDKIKMTSTHKIDRKNLKQIAESIDLSNLKIGE